MRLQSASQTLRPCLFIQNDITHDRRKYWTFRRQNMFVARPRATNRLDCTRLLFLFSTCADIWNVFPFHAKTPMLIGPIHFGTCRLLEVLRIVSDSHRICSRSRKFCSENQFLGNSIVVYKSPSDQLFSIGRIVLL